MQIEIFTQLISRALTLTLGHTHSLSLSLSCVFWSPHFIVQPIWETLMPLLLPLMLPLLLLRCCSAADRHQTFVCHARACQPVLQPKLHVLQHQQQKHS